MADPATRTAEEAERALGTRITSVYREAQVDVATKWAAFQQQFEAKSASLLQQVADGKITQEAYQSWLRGQVFQGERWKEKLNSITDTLTNADVTAAQIINGATQDVFAAGANWTAYTIEHGAGLNYGFGLYDGTTVSRLLRDNPTLLPQRVVNVPKDKLWNQSKLTNAVTQGIIQGEPLDQIATRFQRVTDMDRNHALTNARTAMTGAQNAGREETYTRAKEMGIDVMQQWVCTLDNHTRDSHRDLDGERIATGDKQYHPRFSNGCRYPGDPSGPPEEVYNCRCTTIAFIPEYPSSENTQRYDNIAGQPIKDMTYEEWAAAKATEAEATEAETTETAAERFENIREAIAEYETRMDECRTRLTELDAEYAKVNDDLFMAMVNGEDTAPFEQQMDNIQAESDATYGRIAELNAEQHQLAMTPCEDYMRETYGEIQGAHSMYDDITSVNRPFSAEYTSDVERARTHNCGYCALTYDARRRGIDCMACDLEGVNHNQMATFWSGAQMQASSSQGYGAMWDIKLNAEKWGPGSRGVITCTWGQQSTNCGQGHAFSFEVDNAGKCVFIDAQMRVSGEAVESYFGLTQGQIWYCRTDDKPLGFGALYAVVKEQT